MVEISTSILSVKKENIISTIYNLEVGKTDYFHIDVMDGNFVKNSTNEIMQDYCSNIKQISNLPLDVHLMVEDIKTYINAYLPYDPNIITFHIEACKTKEEAKEIINYIKDNHIKVGIAIKPNTNIKEIIELLPYIHMLLIMTVEPGFGGQKLIPEAIEKVKEIKEYIEKQQLDLDIEVDGGINLDNAEKLKKAGANIIVAGTSIINSTDYKDTILNLKK